METKATNNGGSKRARFVAGIAMLLSLLAAATPLVAGIRCSFTAMIACFSLICVAGIALDIDETIRRSNNRKR